MMCSLTSADIWLLLVTLTTNLPLEMSAEWAVKSWVLKIAVDWLETYEAFY